MKNQRQLILLQMLYYLESIIVPIYKQITLYLPVTSMLNWHVTLNSAASVTVTNSYFHFTGHLVFRHQTENILTSSYYFTCHLNNERTHVRYSCRISGTVNNYRDTNKKRIAWIIIRCFGKDTWIICKRGWCPVDYSRGLTRIRAGRNIIWYVCTLRSSWICGIK